MTSEQILVAGRYQLGTRIGSGAMGVVWKAHDERLHRTVAVKQLLSQPGLTEAQADEARRRAMREGRIAARLAHPNAITVYDVAEHDNEPWLIMEYLPSKSLATVLNEREFLPPTEAARIGTQVAAALVAAHAAGIVHRDVKPANVLLGEDGTVKITDFGISRATGDVTVTATGMLAGTPAYLAPEVAKGEQPTSAADVFSLGSTLYTAVEGHSPFGLSENTLALLYAVAAGKVMPPRQAGPLTALLMQLLRADPRERPTMTEAKDALAAVAAGKPLPSIAIAHQRTDPYPKPPRPIVGPPPGTPPHGHPGTRLDLNPFAEPTPSGARPVIRPDPGRSGPPSRANGSGPRTPAGGGRGQRPVPRKKRADSRSILLTVLAIVAAALIGILVASLLNATDSPRAGGTTSTTVPPVTSASPTTKTTTTTQPTTTTTRTTTTTTTTTATTTTTTRAAAEYENAVREYYGLLPHDTKAAWELLTERARAKSNGYAVYKNFYDSLISVQLTSARVEGDRVAAEVVFVNKRGKVSSEPYSYALVEQDGKLKIDNYAKTGDG
ncbi:serine/threonine-protein kinase [Actinokineospora iranica]|uniref:non-specific serine/threonine protein kinase n=1 Tax=Actinokineospora iranica TaxID=1271860 RepID=A0A1G6Z7E7_9PSEU|nr:serine/threonine-protein kinase [Actinokineospora iranica]SDD97897.1 Serine/threonine protein kinase [Actinokineospora iranica]